MTRLLISCGEPSGDTYGARLVSDLRAQGAAPRVFGLGGDHLLAEGASLVAHVRDLAVVGLWEVVSHLPRLRGVFRDILREVDQERPAAAILVDYPDFNLRLAKELAARGIPVIYYVSPQVWAWRRGRVRSIRESVSRMLVIFPFEEEFYRESGVPVTFVGHPLVGLVRPPGDPHGFLRSIGLDPARPVIAVLPGSRHKEVVHNLPPIAEAIRLLGERRPALQFVLPVAPSLRAEALMEGLGNRNVHCLEGRAHEALATATAAIVASGTATVEAALLGAPMVVVYRLSRLTYWLGRRFVSVPHFAMVNLIAGRRVVPEIIQHEFTGERVAREVLALIDDENLRRRMKEDLATVRALLGGPGASARAAQAVLQVLEQVRPGSSLQNVDSPGAPC